MDGRPSRRHVGTWTVEQSTSTDGSSWTVGSTAAEASTEVSTTEPTIRSERTDYAPGDLVVLTGENWQGDATVRVVVNDDAGQTWGRDVIVDVATNGTIGDMFTLPVWFVATYSVTATGQDSGRVARATFTDSVPIQPRVFDQAQNGHPLPVGGGVAAWGNGAINEQNSTYREGMSTPQRLVISGGPASTPVDGAGYRNFTFSLEMFANGLYSYDFPTGGSASHP